MRSYAPTVRSLAAVLVLVAAAPTVAFAAPSEDVQISAAYDPGGTCSECYAWRLAIRNDGTVIFEVKSTPGWGAPDEWVRRSTPALSPRALRHLGRTVEQSRFIQLKETYSAEYRDSDDEARIVTDQDTVVLEATRQGTHRRVEIYGLELVAGIGASGRAHKDREAGRRFSRLWAGVLEVIHSPNAWQEARVYR